MKKNQKIALIIGLIGLIVMFFFPEPETNFGYYLGFIVFVVGVIIILLKTGKKKKK